MMKEYLFYAGVLCCIVLGIWLLIKILAAPIKGILKFILHAAVGLLNVIGGVFDFYIPLTWISVILAGVGGIPGVILLILIHLLF